MPTHRKSFNDKNAMLPLYNLFSSTKKLSPLKFYTFLNLNTRSSSANAYETKRSLDCLAFIQRTALYTKTPKCHGHKSSKNMNDRSQTTLQIILT